MLRRGNIDMDVMFNDLKLPKLITQKVSRVISSREMSAKRLKMKLL